MHYRGLLRVARREGGIRLRGAQRRRRHADLRGARRLVDVIVANYAPLPLATLGQLLSHLGVGVPQWRGERAASAGARKARLAHQRIDSVDWYRPAGERLVRRESAERVRLLAPFDPLVGIGAASSTSGLGPSLRGLHAGAGAQTGYYALPLLWRNAVIGWANATSGARAASICAAATSPNRAPREAAFQRELEAEVERLREFLIPR